MTTLQVVFYYANGSTRVLRIYVEAKASLKDLCHDFGALTYKL